MEKGVKFIDVSFGTYLPYIHSSHKSLMSHHMLYCGRWQRRSWLTHRLGGLGTWLMPYYKFGIPRLS